MGLPVVCYDVGGLRELITDGTNGFLVPFEETEQFAERLLDLAHGSDLRERVGSAARETILEHRNFAHAAEATLGVYRKLVERHAGNGAYGSAPARFTRLPDRPLYRPGAVAADDRSGARPGERFSVDADRVRPGAMCCTPTREIPRPPL